MIKENNLLFLFLRLIVEKTKQNINIAKIAKSKEIISLIVFKILRDSAFT